MSVFFVGGGLVHWSGSRCYRASFATVRPFDKNAPFIGFQFLQSDGNLGRLTLSQGKLAWKKVKRALASFSRGVIFEMAHVDIGPMTSTGRWHFS